MNKRQVLQTKSVGWQNHFRVDTVAIPTSEDINEFLFPFLEKYRSENLFIFIWSLDTHGPFFHRNPDMAKFSPPSKEMLWNNKRRVGKSEKLKGYIKAIYEDMVYYNDYHIGKMVEKLKELNLYKNSLLAITSDHGESFGEHGVFGHAGIPYEEQIKVPLIIKFPNLEFKGSSVEGLVQHIDLYPTILQCLGFMGGDFIQGRNLLPLIQKKTISLNPYIFSEIKLTEDSIESVCLRNNDYKYIETEFKLRFSKSPRQFLRNLRAFAKYLSLDRQMLFNLKDNAGERVNILTEKRDIADRLMLQVREILGENKKRSIELTSEGKEEKEMDEEVKRQLRFLGYFD